MRNCDKLMPSLRKRKASIGRMALDRLRVIKAEDLLWDRSPPVGREFGSPDFERLMEEDYRNRAGVFDPELTALLPMREQTQEKLLMPRRKERWAG